MRIKAILREPLFYLLPLLVTLYTVIFPMHTGSFLSLSLMYCVFALLFLFSAALILRKFKFKFVAISIILLGIAIRFVVGEEGYLQQFCLLLSFGSIIFGVALILNLLGNNRFAYLASLVLVSWPGFVLAAPRIDNDALFYFGALFCMLFAQRYWCLHKNMDILLASVGASIALTAKTMGFVILGVWIIIYVLKTLSFLKIGSLRILFVSILIIASSAVFSNYRSNIDMNTSDLPEGLRVNNTVGNYLYFDLQDYLLEPYASPWIDKGGRQFFWNYALKTSLFGEFRVWSSPIGHIFATALSALALFIFLLALWGIIHIRFNGIHIPPLLFAIFLFTALIFARIINPFSCAGDFRSIFPALFPLVYFSVQGAQILQDSRLRILSYMALLAFAGISFLFIVGQAI
jgi:hypothetical protein